MAKTKKASTVLLLLILAIIPLVFVTVIQIVGTANVDINNSAVELESIANINGIKSIANSVIDARSKYNKDILDAEAQKKLDDPDYVSTVTVDYSGIDTLIKNQVLTLLGISCNVELIEDSVNSEKTHVKISVGSEEYFEVYGSNHLN